MTVSQNAQDLAAVERILAETFSDADDALERRRAVLEEAGRTADELTQAYAPVDELLAGLLDRLEEALAQEARRAAVPLDELGEAGGPTLELDDADVIEITDAELLQAADEELEEEREEELASQAGAETAGETGGSRIIPPDTDGSRAAGFLYSDALWLLGINDGEGALISLERMVALRAPQGDIAEFVSLNQERLLGIYQNQVLGDFGAVLHIEASPDALKFPAWYGTQERVGSVRTLVDGKRSIAQIVEASPMSPLETCCILAQLKRSGQVK